MVINTSLFDTPSLRLCFVFWKFSNPLPHLLSLHVSSSSFLVHVYKSSLFTPFFFWLTRTCYQHTINKHYWLCLHSKKKRTSLLLQVYFLFHAFCFFFLLWLRGGKGLVLMYMCMLVGHDFEWRNGHLFERIFHNEIYWWEGEFFESQEDIVVVNDDGFWMITQQDGA